MKVEDLRPLADDPTRGVAIPFGGRIPWLVVGSLLVTLALLAVAIGLTQTQFRDELRGQLAHRDALGLAALVQKQLAVQSEADTANPIPALLETLILPELPGVLGLQLYDSHQHLVITLLNNPRLKSPSAGQFQQLAALQANQEDATVQLLAAEFQDGPDGPQLQVLLPLPGDNPEITLAAFTLDGSGLAAEFIRLDRNLRQRSWFVFGLLGAAMLTALGLTFLRLIRAQRRLQHQTAQLVASNRELTLAAKTSAVGSVTAHLVHGLKNPLIALQQFVNSLASDPNSADAAEVAADRADAATSARRMKTMIDDVVRVLRDEHGLTSFELSPQEVLEHVVQRAGGSAQKRRVQLTPSSWAQPRLGNRVANLVALILENLVNNAVQAAPIGGKVGLEARAEGTGEKAILSFLVSDNGSGLPDAIRSRLFQPGLTTKEGGTGLGLALSHQLARHCRGELTLQQSGPSGTVFALRIPVGSELDEHGRQ